VCSKRSESSIKRRVRVMYGAEGSPMTAEGSGNDGSHLEATFV
jgi:hypothetical protein